MDKNSVVGLLIIALMIIGYSIYTQPSQEQLAQQKELQLQDSLKTAQEKQELIKEDVVLEVEETPVNDTLELAEADEKLIAAFGDLADATHGDQIDIVIENDYYKAIVNSKGGMLSYLELKGYQTYDSLPLVMFEQGKSQQNLVFDYPGFGRINFTDLYFTPNKSSINISGDQKDQLVLSLKGRQSGQELKLTYALSGDSHALDFTISSKGFNGFDNFNDVPLVMDWNMTPLQKEKYLPWERNVSTIFYKYKDESRDWLSETRDDDLVLEQPTDWIAYKQNYFSVILFSDKGFAANDSRIEVKKYEEDVPIYVKDFITVLRLPEATNGNIELNYFFGPNKIGLLNEYGNDVPRIINYGWSIIGWINRNVILHMFDYFNKIGWGIGFSILLLTIIIKTVLAPLMLKNYKSSAKMRVLKPEVDKINKKFEGKDNTQKQQAIMALYRETGVNPLSGCLPMLVQMPVLYAMFRFFPSNIELRQQSFLWATDLSSYDSIYHLGFHIPLYGDHISLFTLLMASTTMAYTYMSSGNMPETNQPGMPNMKVMMYIFPVMMIFFFNNYSSGLTYYYFLSTLISIIQMWVIKTYFIDEEKILSKLEANKAKPKKQSKFQAKLADMARQQQQMKKKK
jgi:YidC/Oxa1 family membrane protein insertase